MPRIRKPYPPEFRGELITFVLTPGQRHERTTSEELMKRGAIRQENGRMRLRPRSLVADKGYTSKKFRKFLRRRGTRYTIPYMRSEKHIRPIDKSIYKERNKVERLFSP